MVERFTRTTGLLHVRQAMPRTLARFGTVRSPWKQVADYAWQLGSGSPRVVVLGGVHGNELTGIEVDLRLAIDLFT